jgi:hypothetical protein
MRFHKLREPTALNPPGSGIRLVSHAGLGFYHGGAAGSQRLVGMARARQTYRRSSGNGELLGQPRSSALAIGTPGR